MKVARDVAEIAPRLDAQRDFVAGAAVHHHRMWEMFGIHVGRKSCPVQGFGVGLECGLPVTQVDGALGLVLAIGLQVISPALTCQPTIAHLAALGAANLLRLQSSW